MTTDQVLQEEIIGLQKHDLGLETRHLVEEAAQLLADGREMEARALVEKAQAMTGSGFHSRTNGTSTSNGTAAPALAEPTVAAPAEPIAAKHTEAIPADRIEPATLSRISARLAVGITSAVTEAMQDLHHFLEGRIQEVVTTLDGRLTEMAGELQSLPNLQQRVERIEQEATAHVRVAREQWDLLSASVTSLEETGRARRDEAEQFSRSVSAELGTISSRVSAQEERFAALKRVVSDLSPKVVSALEQIDWHTDVLRSMHERQANRAAALNDVLDSIAKLREPKPAASQAAAG